MKILTGWEFLRSLHQICSFQTKEGKKVGKASSSELKRWLLNKAVVVNGEPLVWNELVDFPVISVVLFPKGSTVTLM